MKSKYQELAETLRRRIEVIQDTGFRERDPAAHLEELKRVSETLTQIGNQLPQPIPAELAHYLDRCSYQKALAWLEQLESGTTN